jgi:ribosomal 30S subunit maturation factor RimM
MVTTITWRPDSHDDYDTLKGLQVVSADGEQLGTIEAIFHPKQAMPEARGGHYFLVTPGTLKSWFGSGSEFYVPESAIANVSTDAVRLADAKDQLEAHGWDQQPPNLREFNRA